MTTANGSTTTARTITVPSPDAAPPLLSVKPPLVDRNGWNWVKREGRDAAALAGLVEEFVEYFNARYAWTTEHLIPPCWTLHGALIEEITTLMWSRWSAFESEDGTPEAAETWHTYYLPGFLARVNSWLGNHAAAECRSGNHERSRLSKARPRHQIARQSAPAQ
jgi:hypothetical protein